MDIRRGTAKRIGTSAQVTGAWGKDGGSVTTTYLATFELDGLIVQASASRPLTVADGDDIVVAGAMDDGVFIAHACRNLTRGTLDYEAWWIGLFLGGVFIIGGIVEIIAMLQESPSEWWWALWGVVFALVGAHFARSYNRLRMAEAALRRWNG